MEDGKVVVCLIVIDLFVMLYVYIGDLNKVMCIVKLMSFVNLMFDFIEQYVVMNGVLELIVEVFGDVGKYVCLVFGVVQILFGVCVEIELIVEVV